MVVGGPVISIERARDHEALRYIYSFIQVHEITILDGSELFIYENN